MNKFKLFNFYFFLNSATLLELSYTSLFFMDSKKINFWNFGKHLYFCFFYADAEHLKIN